MNLINILKFINFPIIIIILLCLYVFGSCKNDFKTVDVKEFEELIKKDNVTILDVRTDDEFKSGHIEKAINIDYESKDFIKNCKEKLNKDNTIAIYCQSGYRSNKSAKLLTKENFTVINLKGGIDNWKKHNKLLKK